MEYISTNSCIYNKHCHKEHCISALKSVDKTCPDNALHNYFKSGRIGHMEGLRLFKALMSDYDISSYRVQRAFTAQYDRETDSYQYQKKPITSRLPHFEEMTAEQLIVLLCDLVNPGIIKRYRDAALVRRVLGHFRLQDVDRKPRQLSIYWQSEEPSDGV